METPEDRARAAAEAIVRDLTDRRGLRGAWESIDEDVREEIVATWTTLIVLATRAEDYGA